MAVRGSSWLLAVPRMARGPCSARGHESSPRRRTGPAYPNQSVSAPSGHLLLIVDVPRKSDRPDPPWLIHRCPDRVVPGCRGRYAGCPGGTRVVLAAGGSTSGPRSLQCPRTRIQPAPSNSAREPVHPPDRALSGYLLFKIDNPRKNDRPNPGWMIHRCPDRGVPAHRGRESGSARKFCPNRAGWTRPYAAGPIDSPLAGAT